MSRGCISTSPRIFRKRGARWGSRYCAIATSTAAVTARFFSCTPRKWRRCWLAWGYPDDVVAAAVLHDVLQDTDAEFADLRSRFGAHVAELVAVVSDDPAIADQDERKANVRDRVQHVGEMRSRCMPPIRSARSASCGYWTPACRQARPRRS